MRTLLTEGWADIFSAFDLRVFCGTRDTLGLLSDFVELCLSLCLREGVASSTSSGTLHQSGIALISVLTRSWLLACIPVDITMARLIAQDQSLVGLRNDSLDAWLIVSWPRRIFDLLLFLRSAKNRTLFVSLEQHRLVKFYFRQSRRCLCVLICAFEKTYEAPRWRSHQISFYNWHRFLAHAAYSCNQSSRHKLCRNDLMGTTYQSSC